MRPAGDLSSCKALGNSKKGSKTLGCCGCAKASDRKQWEVSAFHEGPCNGSSTGGDFDGV